MSLSAWLHQRVVQLYVARMFMDERIGVVAAGLFDVCTTPWHIIAVAAFCRGGATDYYYATNWAAVPASA